MEKRVFSVLFFFIYAISIHTSSDFPQEKVNGLIFEHHYKDSFSKTIYDRSSFKSGIFKNSLISTKDFISSEEKDFNISGNRDILYVGPGADTLFITLDYVQDGDIIIFGEGVLLVDNATLTLSGHLYQQDRGQAIFRNGAYLHVVQQYLSQYPQILCDSARFEAIDATVYANTVYRTLMYDNSEYVARRTDFPFWNFRQLYDNSTLIMEDADMVGDLTINDSCQIFFTRCDTILPWFGVGDGDLVDIQFPNYNYVEHFQFDTTHPGIEGIKYSVTFDTCNTVMWGIESWPGSSVNITNSVLSATPRILGSDTVYFENINNSTFYPSLSLPLTDRVFQLVNSYIHLWCIYTYDEVVLYIDSCSWGESHAKDSSQIYATHCTAKGFPSSATSVNNGFFSFTDGECLSFVSAWDRGTTLLINSYISPDRTCPAQCTNLAHGHSYLLAVNCYFEYEPEAMDTALVMVTATDSLSDDTVGATVDILGSAWIDAGPQNTVTFDRYKIYWTPIGDSVWTLIDESIYQISHDILAEWNTSGLNEGNYDLKLTIIDSADDSLTAFKTVTLEENFSVNNITIQTTDLDVHLSWEPVPGATFYKVFSSNNPYTGFEEDISGIFLGSTWISSIINNKKFFYVKAYN